MSSLINWVLCWRGDRDLCKYPRGRFYYARTITRIIVLANDGSYYSSGGYASIKDNAGYCYIYGWCSPKYFRYEHESYSINYWGIWNYYNQNSYTHVYAFIPSTNATTYSAHYYIPYQGGAKHTYVPQIYYYNAWYRLTSSQVYNVYYEKLVNVPGGSVGTWRQIAFDEILEVITSKLNIIIG